MRIHAILLAVFAVLAAVSCTGRSAASLEDARERLDQRENEFLAALAARDADGTAELFAENGVLHVANMPPVEGRDAIRGFYGNVFGFLTASEAHPRSSRLSDAADMAYSIGTTSNEFAGPDGPVAYAGKYLLVWERLEGEWMIVVYSISSDQ